MSDDSLPSVMSEVSLDSFDPANPGEAGVRVRFTLSNDGIFKVRALPSRGTDDLLNFPSLCVRQVAGGIDGTKLQLGDVLVSVDGVLLEGKGITELGKLLRGEPRSTITLELRRGWAQIPIRTELQRRGSTPKHKPPKPAPSRTDDGRSRDPSFRDLPEPAFREMPKRPAATAAAAAASPSSRDRPPPPADMGPLPAPGSRRPSPQSSVTCSPSAGIAKGSTAAPGRSGQGGPGARSSAASPGRSPPFITPVASQVSMNSVASASSENIVQRLSRQVERLDAEAKKKEKETRELKGLLQERNNEKQLMEQEAGRLRLELSKCADVGILKELRARVQGLEDDVRERDDELAERSEHIARLQRQLGATSATGGAMSFLNDLIDAKEKYTEEAQRAKEEAEHVKQRMEQITLQNREKENLIRELENARVSLRGKAEQDGQEAEQLREKVKSLEGLLQAQLRSVMQQLVESMQQIEELAAENKNISSQLALSQKENNRLSLRLDADERTIAELRDASAAREEANAAEQALRMQELEAALQSAKAQVSASLEDGEVARKDALALREACQYVSCRNARASCFSLNFSVLV